MRPQSPQQARIRDLHREHGLFVAGVLSKAGVPPSEVEDAGQEVWVTVCVKLAAGRPEPDSWRAYLTTLAKGLAANHRRAAEHRRTAPLEDEPGLIAQGLSAEQVLILYDLLKSIPNADQREAALLRAKGHSIKEIAAIQGITEAGVKKRLDLAGQQLEKEMKRDDDGEKASAFWGFGSFEKLLDALSEERERQWQNIEAAIQEIETPPEAPSSSRPQEAAPLLPVSPNSAPGLLAKGKAQLAAALACAVVAGGYLGAKGLPERASEAAPLLVRPEPPRDTSAPEPSGSPPAAQMPPRADTAAARPASPPVSPGNARPAARRPHTPVDLRGLLRRTWEQRADAKP